MTKVWLTVLLLAPSFAGAQQGTPVTVSLAGDGVATASGANYIFTFSGTANFSSFGSAGFYASGTTSLSSIGTTGTVTGDFAMLFASGDSLTGQITIPAGYLIPTLGQTVNAAGSATITGGAGNFSGASGFFPSITGGATATGLLSTHLTASGSGTLRLPAFHVAGTLAYAGFIAHLASGGGWKTTIILLNNGATQAQAQLNFFDEAGNPLALRLNFPQVGIAALPSPSVTRMIQAGGELVMESQGPDSVLSVGSSQLFTDVTTSGFIIFRYNPSGQEAAVPLQTQNAASNTLSFANDGGLATGVAVAECHTQPADLPIVPPHDTGRPFSTPPLAARPTRHL